MKPDWDALMADYKDHPTKLVADVDCTTAGKPLCDANGVKGFPTIMYGDPSDLMKYEGGRDAKSLKKHAEEKLVAVCSPKNIDLCDDAKKAEIEKFKSMSDADLAKEIAAKEEELKTIESDFKTNVEGLQKQYEQFTADKESKLAAIKDSGLGLMKSVKSMKVVKTEL